MGLTGYHKGWLSEYIAILWLGLQGYRLRAHRYRHPSGEIDLIMSRGTCICFIEVKYRQQAATTAWAITPRQQSRITRAAQAYLQKHPDFLSYDCRFDAIYLSRYHLPRHLKNCWS